MQKVLIIDPPTDNQNFGDVIDVDDELAATWVVNSNAMYVKNDKHAVQIKQELKDKIQWEIKKKLKEQKNKLKEKKNPTQAELLVKLSLSNVTEFFCDEHKIPYAAIQLNNHREVHSLSSSHFKHWLIKLYWEEYEKVPGAQPVKDALNLLGAKSIYDGDTKELSVRAAWHEGNLYVDLCNDTWQAVKINKEGWKVVDDYPILFKRFNHMKPIAPSKENVNLSRIFKFMPIKKEQRLLFQSYIPATLIADISMPMPNLYGPQGSGKSTIFKMLRMLFDPSILEFLTFPKDKTEFIQQLSHHYVAYYDNVSKLPQWMSDLLCRAVTGEGASKRMLYSDDDDIIYKFRRRVALNGINVSAQSPDLLDRSMLFGLERIAKEDRKEEKKLLAEWGKVVPGLQAEIFSILSEAIKIKEELQINYFPRMADFAAWGEAISIALNNPPNTFLNAYLANLDEQNIEAIEAHPVGIVMLEFLKLIESEGKDEWEGTPTSLLATLVSLAEDKKVDTKQRDWPKSANILTRCLNELKTNLREVNIDITTDIRDGQSRRICIKKLASQASQQTMQTTSKSDGNDGNDATSQTLSVEEENI